MFNFCYKEWLIQNPKYSDIIKSKTLPKEDSNLMKYLFTSYVFLYCMICLKNIQDFIIKLVYFVC